MGLRAHEVEQLLGGLAAGLATGRSCCHIWGHLRHYWTPQRGCTVRILATVPIFALNAWVSLLVEASRRHWASPLTYVCELYESIAILSFMQLVLAYMGGPLVLAHTLGRSEGERFVEHPGPLKHILRPYKAGPDFVAKVTIGILQYAAVSLFLFVVNALVWSPPWDVRRPWFQESRVYIESTTKAAKAVSCGWAMYNLVMFYHLVQHQLSGVKPMLKFLSIKGVVFFTFWQGIVVFAADELGLIPQNPEDLTGKVWSQGQISAGIRHLLICLEMPVFAEMHRCAYPVASPDQDLHEVPAPVLDEPGSDILQLCKEIYALHHESFLNGGAARSTGIGALQLNEVVGRPEDGLAECLSPGLPRHESEAV